MAAHSPRLTTLSTNDVCAHHRHVRHGAEEFDVYAIELLDMRDASGGTCWLYVIVHPGGEAPWLYAATYEDVGDPLAHLIRKALVAYHRATPVWPEGRTRFDDREIVIDREPGGVS